MERIFHKDIRVKSKSEGVLLKHWITVKRKGTNMKVLIRFTLTGLVVFAGVFQVVFGAPAESGQDDLVRVYEVNKKVCDFPEGEDLSTPEAAYATIMRDYMATV